MDPNKGKIGLINKKGRKELLKKLHSENFSRVSVSFYRYTKIKEPELFRDQLYDIMITKINETVILKDILNELLDNNSIPMESKYLIVESASKYEFNLIRKRREIIHLEGFIQNVIYILYNDPNFISPSTRIKKRYREEYKQKKNMVTTT